MKNNNKYQRQVLTAGLLGGAISLFVLAPAATAAPLVPWKTVNVTGKAPGDFTVSNGGSDNGLFGDPTIAGNNILFTPKNFRATASNGGADTTSDRLEFTVNADPGGQLNGINLRELGDYSILRGGEVSAFGGLFAYDSKGNLYDDSFFFPQSSNGTAAGIYDQTASVMFPAGTTSVTVVFNNILSAAANQGGTATIAKKIVRGGVDIEIIVPEPGSLAILLGGSGFTLLRRRRV